MTQSGDDPRGGPPSVRARLEGWREHPLCGPRSAMPDRYAGPFAVDLAAIGELLGLAALDAQIAAVASAFEGATDVLELGSEPGALEPIARPDGGADAVLAAWALPFTRDPIAAIDELERVARRRVAILQAAPGNDLVAVQQRAAEVIGVPCAHHGWLLAHAANRLELAGFRVSLESVPIPVRTPPGGALELAELLARLYFPGHPATAALVAATGGFIAARLAEAGQLSDDGVLLVARRAS